MKNNSFSRRDFLKLSALGPDGLAFCPLMQLFPLVEFPQVERLGRVATTQMELKPWPDENSSTPRMVYEDAVVPIFKEVVGPKPGCINQNWVDTGDGYLWSADLQPVRNLPNQPVDTFPVNVGACGWK